ncbi:MAG: branched-chain amino acid ABC transporter permease [Xanthobacteraceae bacterium]|nr:MAG: branched-chain amino acid ABC transporter permease [Xanthobacteraceae bacterium]
MLILDLGLNALVTGVVLGSIYALVALGLAITFGLLHIPNVAHPAMVIGGSYAVAISNSYGMDPLVAGVLWAIPFYALGVILYEFYSRSFESRGRGNTLQSLTLFFGISLIIEVGLVVAFGTDLRSIRAGYIGHSLTVGFIVMPYRFLIPAALAPVVIFLLWLYMTRTNTGLAIRAVAYEERALQICGLDPAAIKRHAFGIAMAMAALAGAALVITGPIDPFAGRAHIGRVFAVVVLAGMGTIPGTLVAAILIGVAESFVMTFLSPSWAPGVAFAILLATLGLRPNGLFGALR